MDASTATAPPEKAPRAPAAATGLLSAAVLVSALGYFVDLFDLILFAVVRVESLTDLGVSPADQVGIGIVLFNLQNAGLIVGGFLWGILADRRGRVRVLFASIALYSVANLANAFVTDTTQYAILRLLAGIGLAGELGVAITLVTESLPAAKRAWGTVLIAAVGTLGGLTAGVVSQVLPWRAAYALGGVLGLALLALRFRLVESGVYASLGARPAARRGDLRLLLGSRRRLGKLAACVLVGVPNWYVAGVLLTFGPEIVRSLGVAGTFVVGKAVVWAYVGLGSGALAAGFLAARFGSRLWVVYAGIVASAGVTFAWLFGRGLPLDAFYLLSFLGAFSTSYVYLSTMVAAEQFGTNLRATVTASVPNLVRGASIPLTIGFGLLAPTLGPARGALALGVGVVLLALLALRGLEETAGRDLDFVET